MNKSKKYLAIVIVLFSMVLSFLALKSGDNYFEISKNMQILNAVVRETNSYYVDEIEPAKLLETGINAMLKSLDPYTEYYSESEIEDYRFMTTGQYGGIGALISQRGDYVQISEPYEGMPAMLAGIMAGDKLIEIDGKSVKGYKTDEVSKILKGEPNTKVVLTIERDGEKKPIEKELIRKEITIKNVPFYGMVNEKVGYIKFAGFRRDAAKEVREALIELKKNAGFESLILDLRGNPGGLLDEAIKAVNIFVDKGKLVVSTKGKVTSWNKEYPTTDNVTDANTPVIVLTDRGSASASEIVSGSLQDFDRAVILGQNTFGKGLVQTTRSLPFGTQIKITTSKYYIPSGRCIQALDYSNKDEEGRATKTVDSLRKEFKTAGGRKVFDGKGIKPDIETEPIEYPDILRSLIQERLIFDYATQYRLKHEKIEDAQTFKLTEEDYKDFLTFLSDKSYEYSTNTEKKIEELEKQAKNDHYDEALKVLIENLETTVKNEKKDDIIKHKKIISEFLENEIVSRYEFQRGRIKADFDNDVEINKALEILGNKQEYSKILSLAK
jgi:carboxyl-terminal processing protease